MKTLIAYFSRKGNNYVNGSIMNLPVGNTEVVARTIQKLTGGELFEIQTKHAYSADYTACTKEAQQELRAGARPELVNLPADFDQYDTVYLGYPNWWGTMPMAVFTFLERYDVKGKTILPFCTHKGSGMGRSESDLKKACPDATVRSGLAIRGSSVAHAERDIASWVQRAAK